VLQLRPGRSARRPAVLVLVELPTKEAKHSEITNRVPGERALQILDVSCMRPNQKLAGASQVQSN
jgi:hypothetical protein